MKIIFSPEAIAAAEAIDVWKTELNNARAQIKSLDSANKELGDKLHKYGCTLASIYSLVKPLAETNGVHGAIAECIETYTPLAAERQIKS